MAEFRMPSLGADMEQGTVVEWLVKPGDRVERGDVVATIDTDKAEIDVETFESGVVREILVEPGRKVPVGTPLAVIATEADAEPATPARPSEPVPVSDAPPTEAPAPPVEVPAPLSQTPAAADRRLRVSPLARRTATELGVDLTTVTGTGADGAITSADVERAASGAPSPPTPAVPPPAEEAPPVTEPGKPDRAAAMQRAVAAAMTKSHREIPHYYLGDWIDMSEATAWLEETNRARSAQDRLIYAALLLRAVVLATREVPEVNGHWVNDAFEPSATVHLGVAVAVPGGGLISPAILNADQLDLDGTMRALRDLVRRARKGGLRGSEMTDGTITVSNLGVGGVQTVYGLIYPPQVALVGFGKLVERPLARDGLIGAHPQIHATLSADHRASNGHRGARFLAAINRLLQDPAKL